MTISPQNTEGQQYKKTIIILAVLFSSVCFNAQADLLVRYPFGGSSPSNVDPHLDATPLSGGNDADLRFGSWHTRLEDLGEGSNSGDPTFRALDEDGWNYIFSFVISPNASNVRIDYTTLTVMGHYALSYPWLNVFYTVQDDSPTEVSVGALNITTHLTGGNPPQLLTWDISELKGIAHPVAFRIHITGNVAWVSLDDFEVTGITTIPEPATLFMFLLASMPLVLRRME